jgi:hypothetical protein
MRTRAFYPSHPFTALERRGFLPFTYLSQTLHKPFTENNRKREKSARYSRLTGLSIGFMAKATIAD